MEDFFSIENLNLHKEYLRQEKIRYSVYEICYPEIKDKSLFELKHMRLGNDKEKIIGMKADIILHDVFFNSFGNRYEASEAIRGQYRTEQNFLYELYEASREGIGFTVVYIDKGKITVSSGEKLLESRREIVPLLTIDLCEHAYFLDYGFNKEEYLKNAISFLNLKKIEEKLSGKH